MQFLLRYSTTQTLRSATLWPKTNDISAYLLILSRFLFQTLYNFPLDPRDHALARSARTPLCVTWSLLLVLSLTAISAIGCLSLLFWWRQQALFPFSLSVSLLIDNHVFPFQCLFSRVKSPRIIKYSSWGSCCLMPLMILFQCSYGTKEPEKQSQHMAKPWIHIVERKTFSAPLCFPSICVLFDCYNTLSWGFHRHVCCDSQGLKHSYQHCAHHFTREVWECCSVDVDDDFRPQVSSAQTFTCIRLLSKTEWFTIYW